MLLYDAKNVTSSTKHLNYLMHSFNPSRKTCWTERSAETEWISGICLRDARSHSLLTKKLKQQRLPMSVVRMPKTYIPLVFFLTTVSQGLRDRSLRHYIYLVIYNMK